MNGIYRAIIVDDESAVRRGLQNHFDWDRFHIQVVADFPDGQKAWQYVQANPVDLIVTDVRMPNMDGIALAKAVRERFPKVKIVFVSGYEDTEYLRKALKMDAVDYILKSIDLDEFMETIMRVTAKMEQETTQERTIAELEEKLIESIPLLQQRQLMLLVREGILDMRMSEQRLAYLDIPLSSHTPYCVLVLQLKDMWRSFTDMPERQRFMFTVEFQLRCQELLLRYNSHVAFENRLGEYIMFLNAESDDYEEVLIAVSEELRELLQHEYKFDCRIGISNRFTGLEHISAAFESAVNAIHKRYYFDETLAISVDKYEEVVTIRNAQERAQKDICDALMSGDIQRIRQKVEGVFADLDALPTANDQQNFLLYLLLLPTQVLTNVRTGEKGSYDNHRILTERFLYCADMREQKLFLLKLFEEVAQIINSRSEAHSHHIVEKVQDTIQGRYMEQISITSLAEEVYLTPTYLCVLFKQATGQTINEFITRVRIQRAKELLANPNIKLYDVCYQVGYLSPSYFSKLFKKVTMFTPSEYREAALQKN